MCLVHVIMVHNYPADNGVFKSNMFVQNIHEHNQHIRFCWVTKHNQNGVTERSIRIVYEMVCAMMIH